MGGLVLQEALKDKKKETQLLFLSLYIVGSVWPYRLPNSRMQDQKPKARIDLMSMAGYDPSEAIPFWQRMSNMSTGAKIPGISFYPSLR